MTAERKHFMNGNRHSELLNVMFGQNGKRPICMKQPD